jgi:hypothetical protein
MSSTVIIEAMVAFWGLALLRFLVVVMVMVLVVVVAVVVVVIDSVAVDPGCSSLPAVEEVKDETEECALPNCRG